MIKLKVWKESKVLLMWQNEKAKDFDVAISTRVRIARNLKDAKFPHMLSNKESEKI